MKFSGREPLSLIPSKKKKHVFYSLASNVTQYDVQLAEVYWLVNWNQLFHCPSDYSKILSILVYMIRCRLFPIRNHQFLFSFIFFRNSSSVLSCFFLDGPGSLSWQRMWWQIGIQRKHSASLVSSDFLSNVKLGLTRNTGFPICFSGSMWHQGAKFCDRITFFYPGITFYFFCSSGWFGPVGSY